APSWHKADRGQSPASRQRSQPNQWTRICSIPCSVNGAQEVVDIASLGLVVRSDGVVIAGKRLRDFKDDAKGADGAAKGLNNTFNKMASLVGVVAGSFLVKGLVQMTSAWSDLQGRVDLAAGSMEAGAKVMERIESI